MNALPRVGSIVQLFGVGCEGCGNFHGSFKVAAVSEDEVTSLVLDPQEVTCQGDMGKHRFGPLVLEWNPELRYWRGDCNGQEIIVNIGGHYRGRVKAAAAV
jgi:hypothetical protein